MNLVLKSSQQCVKSRNKFKFFISFVKMALSNTFLASISRISQPYFFSIFKGSPSSPALQRSSSSPKFPLHNFLAV